MTDHNRAPAKDVDESADLFDYALIKDWVLFVLHAQKRHRLLAIGCFVAVMAAAAVTATFLPRKYTTSTKILTKQTSVMSTLSNPYRGISDEGPTRAAYETITSRESLLKIIKQTDLVQHWRTHRNAAMATKDQLVQMIGGPWSDEDWQDIMVGTLEKRLGVATNDGTVEISITWPEPQMARQLVEAAQQNFLETRHISEVAAISETIGILEVHASQTQASIDEAVTNLQHVIGEKQKVRGEKAAAAAPARPMQPTRQSNGQDTPAQEITQLRFLLRTKQRAISDLEEFRQRQLTELRTQLDQQRVIYNRSHPLIQELEQRTEALSKDSPQLITLRGDADQLIQELEAKGVSRSSTETSTPMARSAAPSAFDSALSSLAPGMEMDPSVIVAQDQLRVALSRYQDLLLRVEAARLELDTTRAAFKYRFSVVSPALTPRRPIAPNVPMIFLGGLLAAVVLALFAAAGLDLWRRSVVETWQIERSLGLPLLANVKL